MARFAKKKSGYTIIEMLCYIAMFTLFLTFSMRLFLTTGRIGKVAENRIERITRYVEINTAFRNAVREASGSVEGIPGFTSDEQTLILKGRTKRGLPGFVILSGREVEGRLSMIEAWEESGAWQRSHPTTWPLPIQGLQFSKSGGSAEKACITMHYTIAPDPGCTVRNREPQRHEIIAALRHRAPGGGEQKGEEISNEAQ